MNYADMTREQLIDALEAVGAGGVSGQRITQPAMCDLLSRYGANPVARSEPKRRVESVPDVDPPFPPSIHRDPYGNTLYTEGHMRYFSAAKFIRSETRRDKESRGLKMLGDEIPVDPLEALRLFCAGVMHSQDWEDFQPFLDAVRQQRVQGTDEEKAAAMSDQELIDHFNGGADRQQRVTLPPMPVYMDSVTPAEFDRRVREWGRQCVLHDRQQRAEPVKGPSDAEIRDVFLENGFTIKPGPDDLKPYVYKAVRALITRYGAQP